jgi:hypothetical protein
MQNLSARAEPLSLREPSPRGFHPVNNDPVGDDSDDGNGWRAKTRLGANDRTTILIDEEEARRLSQGNLPTNEVKSMYRKAVKTAGYLPLHNPLEGFARAIEGQGRLKGVLLLPVSKEGIWRGVDENGIRYRVSYDREFGLLAGKEL